MTNTILIATKNKHKAQELAALLSGLAEAMNLADWEAANGRSLEEPEEDGHSFTENALIKARAYARATNLTTLADDSGLSVEALGGAPGIHSARYGGPGLTDADRCQFLLKSMTGQKNRAAFFTSILALAKPDGASLTWEGRANGLITQSPQGENGFGYDPVFYSPQHQKTFAQLMAEEKNKASHRAIASQAFLNDLDRVRKFL